MFKHMAVHVYQLRPPRYRYNLSVSDINKSRI